MRVGVHSEHFFESYRTLVEIDHVQYVRLEEFDFRVPNETAHLFRWVLCSKY